MKGGQYLGAVARVGRWPPYGTIWREEASEDHGCCLSGLGCLLPGPTTSRCRAERDSSARLSVNQLRLSMP